MYTVLQYVATKVGWSYSSYVAIVVWTLFKALGQTLTPTEILVSFPHCFFPFLFVVVEKRSGGSL